MKGLIIKQPWIDYILNGEKTWEIRGSNTKTRDRIALIQSGSGFVVGCCKIVDCIELSLQDLNNNFNKHKIKNVNQLPYKRTFAWVITNVKRYKHPQKYKHPQGAIVWVNLN